MCVLCSGITKQNIRSRVYSFMSSKMSILLTKSIQILLISGANPRLDDRYDHDEVLRKHNGFCGIVSSDRC